MSLKCSEYFASCLFVLQTETDFLLLFKDNNENRLAIKNIEVIPKKTTTAKKLLISLIKKKELYSL